MSNKKVHTEKNIEKLIRSSLKNENQLDMRHKEVVLDFLLQKMELQKKEIQPKTVSVIGLSIMWIAAVIISFTVFKDSVLILSLIQTALKMSLLLIPVSSIVLIILKLRTHEKRMV
jgi:hypothetical protein